VKATGRRYTSLPLPAKILVWALALFVIAVAAFFIVVGPSVIAQKLYDFAQVLAGMRFGWLILFGIMVITSFPPLVGYTTTVTLCGFAYGIKGFLLAAPGAVIGSAVVFVVLRWLFRQRLRTWTERNEKWQALETVIRSKGLPLIILIRMSPFPPWVYSNACFASIQAVALWQFVVATICILPKIFLSVFIGSRLALLSDGKEREIMDTTTKILNIVSIVVSVALGIIAGIVLYRLMQKQIKELRDSPTLNEELAAEALEEAEEGAPLLHNLSSESIDSIRQ